MSKITGLSSLPSKDSHNEPSRLRLKREVTARLLEGESVSLDTDESESLDEATDIAAPRTDRGGLHTRRNPLELLTSALREMDTNELVEVFGPFGRITFRAVHVSTHEYGMAFIVNKDHMTYEPTINTHLRIRHNGQEHDVVYLGGYFTFRQMPFTFLSFIKVDNKSDDG